MAALTLTTAEYRDRILGGWQGKSAGVTLGAASRGNLLPGRADYYNPIPGQPVASVALDFPLIWLEVMDQVGSEVLPEDLAVAWLEHLDYSQDEYGYAALNLRRGLPPPASGAHANWFRHATGAVMRADFWAMIAPGAPQVAAAYAYHDAKLDHSEEGIWAAMLLAAVGSAAFFLSDTFSLLTIGLAMIPRNCRTARAVKSVLAAAQRGASWHEAREAVLKEVGSGNYTDSPQNLGFLTLGLLYGAGKFEDALPAAVNCGYDTEAVGGGLGAILGIRLGSSGLPARWTEPLGDLVIPGHGVRDFDAPRTLSEVAERTLSIGRRLISERCPEVDIVERLPEPISEPVAATTFIDELSAAPQNAPVVEESVPAERSSVETDVPQTTNGWSVVPPIENETPTEEAPLPITGQNPVQDAPPALLTPQESVFPPESEPDTPPAPLIPQSVSSATPEPVPLEVVPTPPATIDLSSAIAWADSTLVKPLLITSPNALIERVGPFEVMMDTGDSPTIAYNQPKSLAFTVCNRGSEPFQGRLTLLAPPGWQVSEPTSLGQRQYIAANTGILRGDYVVRVPEGLGRIEIANAITLCLTPETGGAPWEAELLVLGASCWWTVGPFANMNGEGFDRSFLPEDRPGLNETYGGRAGLVRWEKHIYSEATLDLEPLFKQIAGVCYGQTTYHSPTTRNARLVANTNNGVKVWWNGQPVLRRYHKEPFRPLLGSGPWAADIVLKAGENTLLVKWVRDNAPVQFSFTLSDRFGRGLPEVGNTNW